ncbi:MAG: septum formation inhibitor Maf [Oscillatoriales cyanobacterium SM2_3_0]|nr:septum formation inhibitor Maf [Oscillatoriales cyanobacterium SM2_3_0]
MVLKPAKTLILASASPARKRLLMMAGIAPMTCPSHFDESKVEVEDPAELVKALAHCKAEVVAQKLLANALEINVQPDSALILGCDSVLEIGGEIHGKPENAAVAFQRWQQMRGCVGQLLTGHSLIDLEVSRTLTRCEVTQVHFARVTDEQIQAYVQTGEPLNCAGCFAIEGRGGLFIEKIVGNHTNVIGLSLPLFREMLQELGYEPTQFWS